MALTDICNFEGLLGQELSDLLEQEFQRQMNMTDGLTVYWYEKYYNDVCLLPAIDVTGQAILQYFANMYCPISQLRLGVSMLRRNPSRGPIYSDKAGLTYVLTGLETLLNGFYSEAFKEIAPIYIQSVEFDQICDLVLEYQDDFSFELIDPMVNLLINKRAKFVIDDLH